jgi:uncharacterized cupredoxin-like copper-binding protein
MIRTTLLLVAALSYGCAEGASNEEKPVDSGAELADCTEKILLLDYKLDPKALELESGEITLCAENQGKAPHDLAVRDGSGETLARTKMLGPGEADRFTVELEAASYDLYCTQGGHESLGMKGTLSVR